MDIPAYSRFFENGSVRFINVPVDFAQSVKRGILFPKSTDKYVGNGTLRRPDNRSLSNFFFRAY